MNILKNLMKTIKDCRARFPEQVQGKVIHTNVSTFRFEVDGDNPSKPKSGQFTRDTYGKGGLFFNYRTGEGFRCLIPEAHFQTPQIQTQEISYAIYSEWYSKIWANSNVLNLCNDYLESKRLITFIKPLGRFVRMANGAKINELASDLGLPERTKYKDVLYLVVPLQNFSKQLVGIQLIAPAGFKFFLPKSKVKGSFCLIGSITKDQPIGIAEGIATAASVHFVHDFPVFAAMSCKNLLAVATVVRQRYPKAKIVILGDQGNGSEDAKKAATEVGAGLAIPTFTEDDIKRFENITGKTHPTDFNDLYISRGVLHA